MQWLLQRQQSQHVNRLLPTLVGIVCLLPCGWLCTKSDLGGCKVGLLLPCSCMQFFNLTYLVFTWYNLILPKTIGDYIVFVWAKIRLSLYIFFKIQSWFTCMQISFGIQNCSCYQLYSRVNAYFWLKVHFRVKNVHCSMNMQNEKMLQQQMGWIY